MNIIEIKNLSHRFADGTMGLKNINLSIPEGAFVVIAGMNGSGKTTLLRHLNGLLLPTSGTVYLAGVPVSENLVRSRQMVGMVFQDADSQIVCETVFDDVAFGPENLRLEQVEIERRVMRALKTVDLFDHKDKSPHLLSGGEKRRLAIAGILAMEPKVLVFDEPFSSLDYPGVKQVLRQILSLCEAGHTILVAAHDLEGVIAHADRLVIMNGGSVVRDGLPAQLLGELETFGIREPLASRLGVKIQSWLS
ncbi:MAG: ABC transporter ATP-binding protein [Desulfobacterales bacterium]